MYDDKTRKMGRVRQDLGKLFQDLTEIVHPLYLLDEETVWHPFCDVYETAGELVVKLELAGVGKEDVAVSLVENTLVISGVRQDISRSDDKRVYHKMEINHGQFDKMILLPENVSGENIRTSFKDGILDIRVPKLKKKVIEIKVE